MALPAAPRKNADVCCDPKADTADVNRECPAPAADNPHHHGSGHFGEAGLIHREAALEFTTRAAVIHHERPV